MALLAGTATLEACFLWSLSASFNFGDSGAATARGARGGGAVVVGVVSSGFGDFGSDRFFFLNHFFFDFPHS